MAIGDRNYYDLLVNYIEIAAFDENDHVFIRNIGTQDEHDATTPRTR